MPTERVMTDLNSLDPKMREHVIFNCAQSWDIPVERVRQMVTEKDPPTETERVKILQYSIRNSLKETMPLLASTGFFD